MIACPCCDEGGCTSLLRRDCSVLVRGVVAWVCCSVIGRVCCEGIAVFWDGMGLHGCVLQNDCTGLLKSFVSIGLRKRSTALVCLKTAILKKSDFKCLLRIETA